MSAVFQDELAFLGAGSSPTFVRGPEGNGCAERFIRTLKENLLWVQTFDTVKQLRLASLDFRKPVIPSGSFSSSITEHQPPPVRFYVALQHSPRSFLHSVSSTGAGILAANVS